jgi:hypothetical protein
MGGKRKEKRRKIAVGGEVSFLFLFLAAAEELEWL